ncbi:MAG: adenylate/guanylate cyclase [Bacteroidetes bacterium]|jgi:CitB family two-component system response regulator MalR|nr:adenylate/guanylate cyclase [Bacteroidota bacterium]
MTISDNTNSDEMDLNIVLVDDNEDFHFFLQSVMNEYYGKSGVVSFFDGKTAVDYILDTKNIDMLFLDIDIPHLNGFEILLLLKNAGILDHLYVIIMSSEERLDIAGQYGASEWYQKPNNIDSLRQIVSGSKEKFLQGRRQLPN